MSAISLPDAAAMAEFGAKLARALRMGDTVLLLGPLGAGKTTLAQAIISTLSLHPVQVTSPTFTLVQTYPLQDAQGTAGECWHVDLYRLESPEEVEELGLGDALSRHLCLIEWPERAQALLPQNVIAVHIYPQADGTRMLTLALHGGIVRPEIAQLNPETSCH